MPTQMTSWRRPAQHDALLGLIESLGLFGVDMERGQRGGLLQVHELLHLRFDTSRNWWRMGRSCETGVGMGIWVRIPAFQRWRLKRSACFVRRRPGSCGTELSSRKIGKDPNVLPLTDPNPSPAPGWQPGTGTLAQRRTGRSVLALA
jgi:hypothetical protein